MLFMLHDLKTSYKQYIPNISITNNRLPLKHLLQILDNYSEINYRKTIYKILLSVNFNRKIYKAVYKLLA